MMLYSKVIYRKCPNLYQDKLDNHPKALGDHFFISSQKGNGDFLGNA
jgi:hypothetical protein